MALRPRRQLNRYIILVTLLASPTHAQDSKRGFAFIGDTHTSDNRLLSSHSPLTWYYNWSPYPNSPLMPSDSLEFIPMIHSLAATQDPRTEDTLKTLPKSSTHLLAFNEPDGTTDSGGTSLAPKDAARAYIDYVAPFRTGSRGDGRRWKISHPSTTGSPSGLAWLRAFNTSCYEIDAENGCPADFIAAHWYGPAAGLEDWLATLHRFYNGGGEGEQTRGRQPLGIWVTELAVPQVSASETRDMMASALAYLDNASYVERYAWFGAFRKGDANEWTGDGVALFDDRGGLTELGALYMGEAYTVGQKGDRESAAGGLGVDCLVFIVLGICSGPGDIA